LPLYPDTSIKLLLKSYLGLKKFQYDIKIVPISIEYDRIFDSKYLSTQTHQGIFKPGTSLADVMKRIFLNRKGKLGKCMVKHADPIDLDEYVGNYFIQHGRAPTMHTKMDHLSHRDFEGISMQLTKDLYMIQQKEQPIMMNAILSSCFLFSQKNEMTFAQAKKITGNIYQYIKDKKCKTYICGPPQNFAIK
jgi:glycerol-3-phosphate O-acyltransferase